MASLITSILFQIQKGVRMVGKGRMMNYANWPKTMFWGEVF